MQSPFIYTTIVRMSELEKKILCLLAYYPSGVSYSALQRIYSYDKLSRIIDTFEQKGYCYSFFDKSYASSMAISPDWYLYSLRYLFSEKTEFESYFKSIKGIPKNREQTLLEKAIKNVSKTGGKCATIIQQSITKMYEYLIPCLFDPDMNRFIDMVSNDVVDQFIDEAIDWSITADVKDTDHLLSSLLDQRKDSIKETTRQKLTERLSLYYYYTEGKHQPIDKPITQYGYTLLAVKALHRQDYNTANKMFRKALTLQNKTALVKNVFNNLLDQYFLVMSLSHNTNDGISRFEQMLRKDTFAIRDILPSLVIGRIVMKPESNVPENAIDRIVVRAGSPLLRIYNVFSNYIVTALDATLKYQVDKNYKPHIDILRHEFQHILNLDEEDADDLNKKYGKSLVMPQGLVHKWERILNELVSEARWESADSSANTERKSRLVYFVSGGYVNVKLQTRLKNGNWSNGRELTPRSYSEYVPEMDESDLKIYNKCANAYSMTIEDTLPFLVGDDRVFKERYYESNLNVIVDEEKPFIVLGKTKEGFKFQSNLKNLAPGKTTYVIKKDETHYTVIKISSEQYKYFIKLLSIPTIPASEENALKKILPAICNKVDIHSPILEGENSLDTIDGTPRIALKIRQSKPCIFTIQLLAHPLENGKKYPIPGEGNQLIIDSVENKRYQVKRRLRKEIENKNALLEYVDDMDDATRDIKYPLSSYGNSQELELPLWKLLAVMEYANQRKDCYDIEWEDGRKQYLIQPKAWDVNVKQHGGWFEIEGEVKLDGNTTINMARLLKHIGETVGGKFIKIGNDEYITITDTLRKQLERIEAMSVCTKDKILVPKASASLLANVINGDINIKQEDNSVSELCQKIEESYSLNPQKPRALQATLRDYQSEGFKWMAQLDSWGAGACLADDMGLGKTVQTIALLLYKRKEGPSLVIAPTSVVTNWKNEMERFAPTLHTTLINTLSSDDRKEAILKAKAGDVMLTTYGILSNEQEDISTKEWNVICLDEAHTIKNRETKMAQAVYTFNAKTRIALTGTPLQNHLGELWSLFNFINPGMLGTYDMFREKFIVPIENGQKERQKQLKRIILPFVLRRTKNEVVEELPDKTETVRYIELSKKEMSVYELIREEAKKMLESDNKVSMNVLAEITKLRQAACAATLARPKLKLESSKIEQLMQLVDEIISGENHILIFSQFTSFLKLIKNEFDKRHVGYLYLDGGTPLKQRENLVEQFQNGESPIFIISLKAGGLGLNLTGANYVIHMDPWWNPAIEQQATDRAYRIGQRQKVTVYHLISEHTIEEKILRLHKTKRDMADSLLEGADVSHKLSVDELRDLLA